mgnify:CR=1 FL=1
MAREKYSTAKSGRPSPSWQRPAPRTMLQQMEDAARDREAEKRLGIDRFRTPKRLCSNPECEDPTARPEVDADGNGSIDEQEGRAAAAAIGEHELVWFGKLLLAADESGSGTIELPEWINYWKAQLAMDGPEALDELQRMHDQLQASRQQHRPQQQQLRRQQKHCQHGRTHSTR